MISEMRLPAAESKEERKGGQASLRELLGTIKASAFTGYLDVLGRASLGIGLLVVGSALDLDKLARPRLAHAVAVGLKLDS